eukprot:203360-Pelagomonas_calceolata.AAC.2
MLHTQQACTPLALAACNLRWLTSHRKCWHSALKSQHVCFWCSPAKVGWQPWLTRTLVGWQPGQEGQAALVNKAIGGCSLAKAGAARPRWVGSPAQQDHWWVQPGQGGLAALVNKTIGGGSPAKMGWQPRSTRPLVGWQPGQEGQVALVNKDIGGCSLAKAGAARPRWVGSPGQQNHRRVQLAQVGWQPGQEGQAAQEVKIARAYSHLIQEGA